MEYNPATSLQRGVLQAHKAEHYPTINARDLPAFMKALDKVDTSMLNKLAIRILLHTFVRQGELRQARWEDIDWNAKQWVLPPATTKMRREHIVPLSRQVIALLKELHDLVGNNLHGVLFPSQNRQKNITMCENTINNVLKKMGYKGKLVGHGFRALASTTLNEKGYRPDVIERQLAHKETNAVRAAYNRAEYLDERRTMMQAWSDYLDKQATAGDIVHLKSLT